MIRLTRPSICWWWPSIVLGGLLAGSAMARDTIREGAYTSPSGQFSVSLPKPSNWAGLPYEITLPDDQGDPQYERVMFHVGDFGEYLVIAVRTMPDASVSAMNQDDPRTVLRNISQASLMGWRRDLSKLPDVTDEEFFDSDHGEAIVRVYRARKASFLVGAQGRGPKPGDRFDTHIASIVARDGAQVVFVLAQNDSRPDDAQAVKGTAEQVFQTLKWAVPERERLEQ